MEEEDGKMSAHHERMQERARDSLRSFGRLLVALAAGLVLGFLILYGWIFMKEVGPWISVAVIFGVMLFLFGRRGGKEGD